MNVSPLLNELYIKDNAITNSKIADNAVDLSKLQLYTEIINFADKILSGLHSKVGIGTKATTGIKINTDEIGLEVEGANNKLQLKDNGITTAKIQDNAVDLSKLQLYKKNRKYI